MLWALICMRGLIGELRCRRGRFLSLLHRSEPPLQELSALERGDRTMEGQSKAKSHAQKSRLEKVGFFVRLVPEGDSNLALGAIEFGGSYE